MAVSVVVMFWKWLYYFDY